MRQQKGKAVFVVIGGILCLAYVFIGSSLAKGVAQAYNPSQTPSFAYLSALGGYDGVLAQKPVIVAVIDAGVQLDHEAFSGVVWKSEECRGVKGELLLRSCTGGYDFVDEDFDPSPSDNDTHGTGVASVIAHNAKAQTASESALPLRIMSLRVSDDRSVQYQDIAEAIYFAVHNGASIINMSLSFSQYSSAVARAVAYAHEKGVVLVASAGNKGVNIDLHPTYPATLDGVISVTALEEGTEWKNSGKSIDVRTTASDIIGASSDGAYQSYSGTSFASALVTAYLTRTYSKASSESSQTFQSVLSRHDALNTSPISLPAHSTTFERLMQGIAYEALSSEGGEVRLDQVIE
jgi:subtilisin family serine protease